MTANKVYLPAYIGGKILGVQMTIQNASLSDVTCSATNGIYYTFDGRDYQLLSLNGITIESGITKVIHEDKVQALIPNSDIKIMIETAGLVGCIVDVSITWEVA